MQELMFSQLFSSSNALLHAVFLAGLFAVVLFRRESIAIPGLFKLAYLLFALSIALPAFMTPFFVSTDGFSPRGFRGWMTDDVSWVLKIIYSGAGPALFALSLICAFAAMFPRNVRYVPPAAPAKHPLD